MWANVLLFLVAVVTAVYFYLTKNVGWFKARGVCEHDAALPFGCPEVKQVVMGQRHIQRITEPIYFKYVLTCTLYPGFASFVPCWRTASFPG